MCCAFFLGSWLHGHYVIHQCMKDVDIKKVTNSYRDKLLFQKNWLDFGTNDSHKIYQYKKEILEYMKLYDTFNGED